MKKRILSIILSCIVLTMVGCGSSTSNVVDYSGKAEDKVESTSVDNQESISTKEQEEVASSSSTEEQEKVTEEQQAADSTIEESVAEAAESVDTKEDASTSKPEKASYNINVIRFDITNEPFGDGYRYEGIVEVENTGNSNIYLTGTAFDIEDANGSLIQSDNFLSCCPDVIKPGEKGYIYNQFGSSLAGVNEIDGLQLVPQYVVKTTSATPAEYDISDVSIKDDTFGVKTVGRVTNNTEKDNSIIYVQVLYYDSDGNLLGISGTNVTDLLAGRTVSFEISGIGLSGDLTADKVADYKVIARETFYGW